MPDELPTLTKEQIKAAIEEGKKRAQEAIDRWDGKICPYKPREGKCRVCGGVVTETYSKQYDPRSGPMIYGPGSRNQYNWTSSGLYCQDCGLSYHKLPKNDNPKSP